MNPNSKSTPCRIVFNSSAKIFGYFLNDYFAKGQSMLNKLLGVIMRFREVKHAFIGDIAKMYHTIAIPQLEQMTRLFLWRDLHSNNPFYLCYDRCQHGRQALSHNRSSSPQEISRKDVHKVP